MDKILLDRVIILMVINVKEFWTNNYFLDFSVKRFLRGLNECHGVVLGGLELADGSLLMADRYKANSRSTIKCFHSSASIFHLFNLASIQSTPFFVLIRYRFMVQSYVFFLTFPNFFSA